MTDEVFKLMHHFPDSKINMCGEVVLDIKTNTSFIVKGVEDPMVITYKLLEWASRPIAKGQPYADERRNIVYRRSMLLGVNNYLGTHFTEADMYVIYDRLGNAINRELTTLFVESGFDMAVLRMQQEKT